MDTLWKDFRAGLRCLLKQPVFTAIAVLTLALGIGANTAIFSVVNALLLKPLPFPELRRIVALWDKAPSRGIAQRSDGGQLSRLARPEQSFELLGLALVEHELAVDPPERVQVFLVTANYLDVIGVKPLLGRSFLSAENEPGKDAVAVLSFSLWQRRFGGDPHIINKTVVLNGINRTVVGVMPEGINYPKSAEVYAPLAITPELAKSRGNHSYYVIGRLKSGISIKQAQGELDAIAARLEQQYPETNTGWGVTALPIIADTVRLYSTALWVLKCAVGFVLLIDCANVAKLMLARAAGRRKDCLARGAGSEPLEDRAPVADREFDSFAAGGVLGVLIAYWSIDLIRVGNPGDAARLRLAGATWASISRCWFPACCFPWPAACCLGWPQPGRYRDRI
jgi:putative ABC transport system permease protein